MSKKSRGGGGGAAAGEDPEDLSRSPLQAVLLADSFTLKFRPITLERPKVLLPLVNVPMIEYTLSWLESAGVEECFVFCCAHAQQVKEHLGKAGWTGKPAAREMTVTAVESHDAISAGDALRVMYGRGVIHGDFVLISGDTISNMNLKDALQEHKDRRKKDPLAVMTMPSNPHAAPRPPLSPLATAKAVPPQLELRLAASAVEGPTPRGPRSHLRVGKPSASARGSIASAATRDSANAEGLRPLWLSASALSHGSVTSAITRNSYAVNVATSRGSPSLPPRATPPAARGYVASPPRRDTANPSTRHGGQTAAATRWPPLGSTCG
ncbi:hypothetical protein OsJ_08829 [Oryza sativa Japonica Group]|uniref:Nucleotidyl transferase domain-containing protein n=1 Tax=Oryza sativa subsp. japonica TaxID=39947 RepID=A3ACK1_ORYSJ|nr:hypothetical protein OsJ_08829 [Oryza sativa Japonica Group]